MAIYKRQSLFLPYQPAHLIIVTPLFKVYAESRTLTKAADYALMSRIMNSLLLLTLWVVMLDPIAGQSFIGETSIEQVLLEYEADSEKEGSDLDPPDDLLLLSYSVAATRIVGSRIQNPLRLDLAAHSSANLSIRAPPLPTHIRL